MKTSKFISLFGLLSIAMALFVSSCTEKPVDPPSAEKSVIDFKMLGYFNENELKLAGPYYVTANGDSIQPVTLIYHINHFRLHKSNGDTVHLFNTWHMMDFSNPSSTKITFKDIPQGDYESISFTIGVEDSLTNADGLISNLFTVPMYWSMNSGYIHFKFEGNSPQAPNRASILHVGGYTGEYQLSRTVRLNFSSGLELKEGQTKTVDVKMDLAKYFSTPNNIDLKDYHLIHQPNAQALDIANNWPSMFSIIE